jgi:hypothetical protein
VLGRVAIGRPFSKQDNIGVADDLAAARRHQMREALVAQVLAPFAQIVGRRRAAIVDALLDAAPDMPAISR